MLNPVVHTLMIAQVRYNDYEHDEFDAIDTAARQLYAGNSSIDLEDIRYYAREYAKKNDSLTDAIAAVWTDLGNYGDYRSIDGLKHDPGVCVK